MCERTRGSLNYFCMTLQSGETPAEKGVAEIREINGRKTVAMARDEKDFYSTRKTSTLNAVSSAEERKTIKLQ